MIIDLLNRARSYAALHPLFPQAFAFLECFDLSTPDGRYELAGSDLYASIQSYETMPSLEKKFESHREYIDIQFLADGLETMLYAPVSRLAASTDYHDKGDYLLYHEPDTVTRLDLKPGDFAIFFPDDGHKPGVASGAGSRVKKVVLKVRVRPSGPV